MHNKGYFSASQHELLMPLPSSSSWPPLGPFWPHSKPSPHPQPSFGPPPPLLFSRPLWPWPPSGPSWPLLLSKPSQPPQPFRPHPPAASVTPPLPSQWRPHAHRSECLPYLTWKWWVGLWPSFVGEGTTVFIYF